MFGADALAAVAWFTKLAGYGSFSYAGWALWEMLTYQSQNRYDLFQHVTIIGGTGSGKTNAMKHKAKNLFDEGWSVWWFSVQRRSADELLSILSDREVERVTWLCPDEPDPLRLNLLACQKNTPDEWSLIAEQTIAIFQQQDSAWGQNIAETLGNAVYAVLEWGAQSGKPVTLWDAVRLLCEEDFRTTVVAGVTQPAVRAFFETVFPTLQNSVIRAVARILRLLRNDHLLRVLSSPDSISVSDLMDHPGLHFVVADVHGLGSPLASALYLSIVLSKIEGHAYGRNAWATPCALFLDEFPLYATTALTNLLEQGRRHNMSLWLACQGTWQGHVAKTSAWQTGTWHIFRPQVTDDSPKMAKVLDVDEADLKALPNCVSISRELIHGSARKPRPITWGLYPKGSADRLAAIKVELLRSRKRTPAVEPPEITLPRIPAATPPPAALLPRVPASGVKPVSVQPQATTAAMGQPPRPRKGGRTRL